MILKERKYNTLEGTYNYLTKMPIDSVVAENVKKLLEECESKKCTLQKIEETSISTMWSNELIELKGALKIYRKNRQKRAVGK